jgi:hypothetical protein
MATPASSNVPIIRRPWRSAKPTKRQRRDRPAEERRHGKRIDAERLQDRRRNAVAERNRRDRGECGTRGHADQPRIGERVAE